MEEWWVQEILGGELTYFIWRKINQSPHITPSTKIKSRWIRDQHVKSKNDKIDGRKEENIYDLKVEKVLLKTYTKCIKYKPKNEEFDYIKIKYLCFMKDINNTVIRWETEKRYLQC